MPKYRVIEKSFINNALHDVDAIVEFDGIPGPNLEPLDKAGEKAAKSGNPAEVDLLRQQAAAKGMNTEQLPSEPSLLA